jgi:hypothetical protein
MGMIKCNTGGVTRPAPGFRRIVTSVTINTRCAFQRDRASRIPVVRNVIHTQQSVFRAGFEISD